MKITLYIVPLLVSSNLFSNESVDEVIGREIKICLNSQHKAQDIYGKIKDKNLKDKSEIETIISYQHSLSNIEADCKKIYIFKKDAEQAGRLALEVGAAIKTLE